MPFPIDDLSQPFRRPSELKRLAQAVFDAGDYDEKLWIEWKSRLDLMSESARLHLVKQILGFANRDPQVAAKWCQGNAYLLVGVSPGELRGITAIDPETLGNRIRPYIGSDITWDAEYIEMNGQKILIIEVGPPVPGDTIHFLMKDLLIVKGKTAESSDDPKAQGFHHGTILIRRPGQVERADHAERQMLLRRARASAKQLDVEVRPDRAEIESSPLDEDRLVSYLQDQRTELIAAKYEPPDDEPESAIPFRLSNAFPAMRDPRTREDYEAEIDAYLVDLEATMRGKFAKAMEEHRPAQLGLLLVNRSEQPFRTVRVTAIITGDGAISTTDEVGDGAGTWPEPPKPYGTPQPRNFMPHIPAFGRLPSAAQQIALRSPWEAIPQSDGLHVEFEAVDLHGHSTVSLPHVPLWISSTVEAHLTVQWSAASLDAPGKHTGTFTLAVAPSTCTLASEDES